MLKPLGAIPASFFSRDGKKLSFLVYAFLLLLCVGFFTPGISTLPPTDRDESSFAQATKQMIETGNYTDIRLQEVPRYKKPIGIYWLQSAAVRVLSPDNLNAIAAYRAPSFLGATVAVLMTAALGSLLFSPAVGLLAGMMLAGCVLMGVEARLAKTDAALLGCIVTAMYALARAKLLPTGAPKPKSIFFAFWTAMALGILIKGPIILLPVLGTILWVRVGEKQTGWFKNLRPWTGLFYTLALVAPWFVAIMMQSHGAFMEQSAGHDMLAKLWQGQDRGAMPPGAHAMALPILFFPFSLFVVFALPDMWRDRKDAAVRFCLGWIVPTWIVFEVSFTKLPHYVLPAYPALALLTAKSLTEGLPALAAARHRLPTALIVAFWLALGTGFAALPVGAMYVLTGVWSPYAIFASLALFASMIAALLLFRHNKNGSLVALGIGSVIFLGTTFGHTVPNLKHVWLSKEILSAVETVKPCASVQIVTAGYREPSLVFLAGTQTILTTNGKDAAQALQQDSCRVAAIHSKHQQAFLDAFPQEAPQPEEAGKIEALNSGHGNVAAMTLYVLPKARP